MSPDTTSETFSDVPKPVEGAPVPQGADSLETAPLIPQDVIDQILKPQRSIYTTRMLIDEAGRQVTQTILVSGPGVVGGEQFIAHGKATIRAKMPNPTGGPAQEREQSIPINVQLNGATNVEHAFQLYDEAVAQAAKSHIDQLKSQHIRAQLADGLVGG